MKPRHLWRGEAVSRIFIIYSFHWYPRPESEGAHFSYMLPGYAEIQQRLQVPLLVGEFSAAMHFRERVAEKTERYLKAFNDLRWGWVMYTYKKAGEDYWGLYSKLQTRPLDLLRDDFETIKRALSSCSTGTFRLQGEYLENLAGVL